MTKCDDGLRTSGVWATRHHCWMNDVYLPGQVSVIIPARNCARVLVQALESVLAQTYRPIEAIVVDDGSTDGTRAAVVEWGRRTFIDGLFDLRMFHQEPRGAAAARNRGLIESRGEYIQFLDADDVLSRGKIASQVSILTDCDVEYVAAYGPWRHFAEVQRHMEVYEAHRGVSGGDWLKRWLSGWFSPVHSLLWKRCDVATIGPWDESLTADDDGEFAMRYLASGGGLVFCQEAWVYYRQNPNWALSAGGISSRCTGSSIRSRIRVIRRMERFLEEAGLLDGTYRHALAQRYYWTAKFYAMRHGVLRRICLRDFRRLSPDRDVPGTTRYRALTRLLGFVLAQRLRFLLLGIFRIRTHSPVAIVKKIEEICRFDEPVSL